MIVSAIIGLLVLIAQTFYADYVTRVNVAKAIAESHWIKTELERLKAESIVIRSSTGNDNSPQEEIDMVYKELASIFNFDGIKLEETWGGSGSFLITWRPGDPNHPIHHVEIGGVV